MAGNEQADFDLEDGDEVILPPGEDDSEEATAVDPFGEEPLNEFLDRELNEDDEEEDSAEEDSSAEDSQEKSESPATTELLKVIEKQQAREDMLVKELLSIRDGSPASKDKDEAVLPEVFEMDEVPDGFDGITDYLNDMGSKQLGMMKRVYAEAQKELGSLRKEMNALRSEIQVGNITRELNVSPEEDKAIAKWADKLGFSYQGDKIPGIIEAYRQLHPGKKGRKNPNGPTDTSQSRTTRKSEDNKRPTGESEQDAWSRIEKRALQSLRGDRIPS
jgi:hypothetical protein